VNLTAAENLAFDLMREHGLRKQGPLYLPWRFEFDNAKQRFGLCAYRERTISLSRYLTELNSVEEVTNTIKHEIAHALVGSGHGHDEFWKDSARKVGARPERCYNSDEVVGVPAPWIATCPGCKATFERFKNPTKTSRKYSCSKCAPGRFDMRFLIQFHRRGTPAPPPPVIVGAARNVIREIFHTPPMFTQPVAAAQTAAAKPKLERDPAGRNCPECELQLSETIPLDINGTCHGCGCCFGKALPPAPKPLPPPPPITPATAAVLQSGEVFESRVVALYQRGLKVVDIAVECGYKRGTGQNRVRGVLIKAGLYKVTS
jgi:predicted SprT family Zn-dependent metalloprotease